LPASATSGCGKSIPRGVAIRLPGIEPRRRIVRTIRRVRIVLRFQAQRVVLAMNAAIFSGHGAVEEIARIKLDSRLIGQKLKDAAGVRIFEAGSRSRFAGSAPAQTEIVIIALADPDLFIFVVEAGADAVRGAEIERRRIDAAWVAQWDAGCIHRQISIAAIARRWSRILRSVSTPARLKKL
jgi:hypothetical protein